MNRGRELMVGTVIIVALVVTVVGTLWLQGSSFGRVAIPIDVLMREVAQLNEGNAVKYRGVSIGRVEAIAVEPRGDAVRVSLLIDDSVELPKDAAALVAPESLFGDWQVEIVSRAQFPRFRYFDVEDDGPGTVRTLGGYALPEISRLTASAEQISDNLAELTDRMEIAFNQETANNLAAAISNMEAITTEVRALVTQQAQVARNVTTSADSALSEIEAASRVARRSFERIESILGDAQIDSIVTSVRIASRGIQDMASELSASSGSLTRTLDRAESAFTRIDRLSARIEAGEGTIGRLLSDSTLALRAEDVLASLDLLLQDLRANPRRYVRLSIF